MRKHLCRCEVCGVEQEYNLVNDLPLDWFKVLIKRQGILVLGLTGDFCSLKCLGKAVRRSEYSGDGGVE